MKILHIGQLIGGLDVYIRNSIIYNTDNSIEYIIATGKKDKHEAIVRNGVQVKEYGINLYRELNPLKDLKGLFEAIKVIKKERPDIIHCHSAKGGVIGRVAGWITGTKTLYTPHAFSFLSTQSNLKKKVYIVLERVCKFDSFLLACSESERQLGMSAVGYRDSHALAWNNAVPDAVKLIEASNEENFVCYIGRPSYQKNPLFFVDVINGVHKVLPDVKFKLLGVGYFSPDLEEMKARISSYGLNDLVELLPWLSHDETLDWVNRSKLYLTVSRYEGLPLAVIEAMSLGKVIIASDVLGNKDCVQSEINGYLLPLDVDSFVEKTICVLTNEDMRQAMGKKSRELFLQNFFIENRIKKLNAVYMNIVNKCKQGGVKCNERIEILRVETLYNDKWRVAA